MGLPSVYVKAIYRQRLRSKEKIITQVAGINSSPTGEPLFTKKKSNEPCSAAGGRVFGRGRCRPRNTAKSRGLCYVGYRSASVRAEIQNTGTSSRYFCTSFFFWRNFFSPSFVQAKCKEGQPDTAVGSCLGSSGPLDRE